MAQITAEEIARALGQGKESRGSGNSWKTMCPSHRDEHPSLSVSDVHGKVLVRCHAGCTQEKVIEDLKLLNLWPRSEFEGRASWESIIPVPYGVQRPKEFVHFKHGIPSKVWEYRDLENRLLGFICRFNKKDGGKEIIPHTYCQSDKGEQKWYWKLWPKPRPLYNLHRLKDWEGPIIIFEGEKAVDAGQKIFGATHLCMTWPSGAKNVKAADFDVLNQREVILWPDADKPGIQAMKEAAEILLTIAKKIQIVTIPENLPEGWDVADPLPEGLDHQKMLRDTYDFEPDSKGIIEEFNKKYAVAMVGGSTVILKEEIDEEGKILLIQISPNSFHQFHNNKFTQVGKQQMPTSKYWMTHEDRKTYERIIFKPEFKGSLNGSYNLWRGFSVEPDNTGDWSIFKDHLLNNICRGDKELYDWVFGWFAHIFQHPGHKSGTSLALRGRQGVGKTIVGKIFGRLIQHHYTLVDEPRQVLGQFNAHLASTILLHADEAFFGGDPRHVGKLKSMVTSDTQRIENKGKDSYEVDNYLRLLITSNQDWIVPAGFEERRFAVLDVGDDQRQNEKYFSQMTKQMKSGGYGGLLYDLLNYELGMVNIYKIPMTKALRDQKELSMSPIYKFWLTCLMNGEISPADHGEWPSEIISQTFYEMFLTYARSLNIRHIPTQNEFFRDIKKAAPEDEIKRIRGKFVNGYRPWAYRLPTLVKARKYFDQMNGHAQDWPEEGNSSQVEDEIPF